MKRETSSIPPKSLTLPVANRDHFQGPIDAPIKIVEYGDYECPVCGQAYPIIKAIQQRFGDRLCFVFRNFPLINSHPHAQHAAEAAEAAGAQGKFWEMHDLLFENQEALHDNDIAEYASTLGLDVRRLIDEVVTGVHTTRVREDFRSGAHAGVNGTPTLFINGVRHDGGLDALLAALIMDRGGL
jgi:protein-disulfide isomerase